MPDVEALADTVRETIGLLEGALRFPEDQEMGAQIIPPARAALDGLVEAAGKAEAGRASAAPESPSGEAGAGAEDTAADFRTLWNNQELWEPEAVGALGRIEQRVAALVEAVRQRDAVTEAAQAFIDTLPIYFSYDLQREVPRGFTQRSGKAAVALFDALAALPLPHRGEPK